MLLFIIYNNKCLFICIMARYFVIINCDFVQTLFRDAVYKNLIDKSYSLADLPQSWLSVVSHLVLFHRWLYCVCCVVILFSNFLLFWRKRSYVHAASPVCVCWSHDSNTMRNNGVYFDAATRGSFFAAFQNRHKGFPFKPGRFY